MKRRTSRTSYLVHLSTAVGSKYSDRTWVNIQSARWVNIQSAQNPRQPAGRFGAFDPVYFAKRGVVVFESVAKNAGIERGDTKNRASAVSLHVHGGCATLIHPTLPALPLKGREFTSSGLTECGEFQSRIIFWCALGIQRGAIRDKCRATDSHAPNQPRYIENSSRVRLSPSDSGCSANWLA